MKKEMPYKFVTREDVKESFHSLAQATSGVSGSAIIVGLAADLRNLCERAIAERDAYREITQNRCSVCAEQDYDYPSADEEAAKILGEVK